MPRANLGRTRRQSNKLYRSKVERAWEAMAVSGQLLDQGLRDLVSESWKRCLQQGMAPASTMPPCAADDEARLEGLRELNHELLLASQNTWRLLADLLDGIDGMLLVTDARGVILDVSGSPRVQDRAAEIFVRAGYEWSEPGAGTNAVGTAIEIGQAAEVESVEHFCAIAKDWACAGVPVRDSVDGSLLGVIDVTTFGITQHGHSLALATAAAHQVEQTLHARELARNVQLMQWYQSNFPRWSHHALMLLDRKGRIVTSNGHAQSLFRDHALLDRLQRGTPLVELERGATASDCLRSLPAQLRALALEGYGSGNEWQGGLLVLDGVRRATAVHAAAQAGTPGTTRTELDLFRVVVGDSAPMTDLKRQALRVSRAAAPALLLGESGSGKLTLARAIHAASSRARGPFVAVNCEVINRELAASELLGYEGGVFNGALPKGQAGKFEQADGGTLFLGQVAALSADLQVQLLRLVDEQVVLRVGGSRERQLSVRVLAAADQELDAALAAGRFRRDLYDRLRVLLLAIAPLRDRASDIASLTETFIVALNEQYGLGPKRISDDLLAVLECHAWPGNVRQLRAVIESMYVLSDQDQLTSADLPPDLAATRQPAPTAIKTIAELERDAIARELASQAGNRSRVARALGISRSTLYRKLVEYGIE